MIRSCFLTLCRIGRTFSSVHTIHTCTSTSWKYFDQDIWLCLSYSRFIVTDMVWFGVGRIRGVGSANTYSRAKHKSSVVNMTHSLIHSCPCHGLKADFETMNRIRQFGVLWHLQYILRWDWELSPQKRPVQKVKKFEIFQKLVHQWDKSHVFPSPLRCDGTIIALYVWVKNNRRHHFDLLLD